MAKGNYGATLSWQNSKLIKPRDRFGGPAARAASPRRNRKRKSVDAPLPTAAPKRACSNPSSQPATDSRKLIYQPKNQIALPPVNQGPYFEQKKLSLFVGVSFCSPEENVVRGNKGKKKHSNKSKSQKLQVSFYR
ncbi:hypothetical protein HYPSUDRAFT_43903 [Hypholoma sublateritium FD-334 SS-4]|uniref:Uncharacterized protein n=1 Tax=Hypholoma sublateritium (strain FD-334 SS-4) TaxID=945553 RepID=A0A0D2M8Z8_HYPSF|nr:hypothetical protein HYPSUDRAFT_43903 [Hypholoma sublateritium FD-334 SS-4]